MNESHVGNGSNSNIVENYSLSIELVAKTKYNYDVLISVLGGITTRYPSYNDSKTNIMGHKYSFQGRAVYIDDEYVGDAHALWRQYRGDFIKYMPANNL